MTAGGSVAPMGLGQLLATVAYRWSAGLVERTDRWSDAAASTSANRLVEYARAQPVLRAFDHTGMGATLPDRALVAQRQLTTAGTR